MEKIIILTLLLGTYIFAENGLRTPTALEKNCLACHKKQQIPNELIYKRYLVKYSTDARMEEAIAKYLNNPTQETSIMPGPFFLKFPMREKLDLDEQLIRSSIKQFLKKFDLKQHLILEK